MSEKLKDCPFCGGEARLIRLRGCLSAKCAGDFTECAGATDYVRVALWNRRTPAPEGEAVKAGDTDGLVLVPRAELEAITAQDNSVETAIGIRGWAYAKLAASPVVPVEVRRRVLDELDKAWLHGQRRTSWRRDESADAILATLRPTDTGANHD